MKNRRKLLERRPFMRYDQSRQMVIDRVVCILRIVTILVLVATVLFGRQNKLLAVVNMALSVTAILIWVFLPQYIHEGKEGLFVWSGYCANETDMLLCCMMPPLFLSLRALRDFLILDMRMLLSVSLAISVLVGIALLIVVKPENNRIWLHVCTFLILFMCMCGICAQLNVVLDFSEPETQLCRVVDQERVESHTRRAKTTSYYWIVVTETGEELKIPVTLSQYRSILKGSIVAVKFSKGALGLDYAYVENQPIGLDPNGNRKNGNSGVEKPLRCFTICVRTYLPQHYQYSIGKNRCQQKKSAVDTILYFLQKQWREFVNYPIL